MYGAAVSSLPRLAPSSRNWTPATPTLSLALAVTESVPDTVAPSAGLVTLAVGGVVSDRGAVFTFTLTATAGPAVPAASPPRPPSGCVPLGLGGRVPQGGDRAGQGVTP